MNNLLHQDKKGFYVDIGAHHPRRFSNSYFFYKKGWRGINIEPDPVNHALLKLIRHRDINVNLGIGNTKSEKTYYQFNDSALNTFSNDMASKYSSKENYHIIRKTRVSLVTLGEVLDKYLPQKKEIDFMSIDTEELDYEVLESNNWVQYRPKIILVEDFDLNLEMTKKSKIYRFLKKQGYDLINLIAQTSIYKLNS